MFNYDWFHGTGLPSQIGEAKRRCAVQHFADADKPVESERPEFQEYLGALECRIILYLKDGLSYEMKEMANIGISSALSFECVPVDENYTVGAYVIVVPFEDIARVEVFAVHPDDRPVENLRIPGFKTGTSEPGR